MSLPKVLILGQPFNNDTGGGITLTNLFSGWDRDKIAVACSGYFLLNNIDTSICNTYYQIGHKEIKWIFPFNFFRRRYYSGLIKFDEKKIQNLTIGKSEFRVKLIMNYFYPLLKFLGLYYLISKPQLSAEFCKWLDEFRPDVIYAQASSRQSVMFCSIVHSYIKKPLVFHMMDDWPPTIAVEGLFKKRWFKKIDKEFSELLDKADVLMSISDQMAYDYKKRYNKKFITFHNTVNIEFWMKYQRKNYDLNDHPILLYAGRIGLGIQTSLELIALAIQKLNAELNLSIKFILQTNERPPWISKFSCVEYRNFISYNDLPQLFSEADFLIIPYDFSQKSIMFIRHSMPTKAPEYMTSGSPIIIFAPEETAIVHYAKKDNWAKVITNNTINDLCDGIKNLIQDKKARQNMAMNAIKIAEKNHNSIKVTGDFRYILSSLIAE